ncbi:hypothetical protein, partial [Botryobacter ruber]|uniref:hypothetical protein n=1 Tax=Botryobacter ruber TaxID=2171629 RepID=UPI00196B05D8
KLASLEGIESLTNLLDLTITTCSKISNIDPVIKLEKLRSLEINNCKDIDSIKPVKNLKHLEKLWVINTNIIDGDLVPCIGRKDAFCTPKKHYSHSSKEIDKINQTVRG